MRRKEEEQQSWVMILRIILHLMIMLAMLAWWVVSKKMRRTAAAGALLRDKWWQWWEVAKKGWNHHDHVTVNGNDDGKNTEPQMRRTRITISRNRNSVDAAEDMVMVMMSNTQHSFLALVLLSL
jgi:hypothetical protein